LARPSRTVARYQLAGVAHHCRRRLCNTVTAVTGGMAVRDIYKNKFITSI
jgi:hypothetical protein